VAVQDAEAPGAHHEEPDAGKHDPHRCTVSARVSPVKPIATAETRNGVATSDRHEPAMARASSPPTAAATRSAVYGWSRAAAPRRPG
jgi:hypothetical protein